MNWYNTYRPTEFEDVIGQDLVKSVLKNSLAKNKIKHAYLFNGSKGIGKTTLARIFAAKICKLDENPEGSIDMIEMDAASNTGIDDVRELIESASNPPLVAPYKVYIIDEVHMLSKPAMNALLKILEEPPVHLVFLLATTNPEKLIPTVLSRLTKLNLTAHTVEGLVQRLRFIVNKEGVTIDDASLNIIAKRAGGSQRDSINLLETVASYELPNLTEKEVSNLLGILPGDLLASISADLMNGCISKETLVLVQNTGLDGDSLLAQLLEFLLDRSFGGDREFDSLVIPVAEVIDLRLPITSVVASLALVQVKIRNPQNLGASVVTPHLNQSVKPISQTKETPAKSLPTENNPELPETPPFDDYFTPEEDIIYSTNIPEAKADNLIKTIIKPNVEPKLSTQPDIQTSINQTTSQSVDDVIQSLNFDLSTPPLFKTFIPAIMVESVLGDHLTLRVSNPFALNQIKNVKNNLWLVNKLKEKFGLVFVLELKEGKIDPKKKVEIPTSVEQMSNDVTVSQPPKSVPIPKKGNIFYSIYGSSPIQLERKDVPVITEIPKPKKSADAHWNSHVEDMFDL